MKFISLLKQSNKEQVEFIAKNYNLNPIVAEIMASRGLFNSLDSFFVGEELFDPFLLNDMEPCINTINEHIEKGSKICVYGDYDVDGICSCSIMYLALKSMGANVTHIIPDRFKHGYGLNTNCLSTLDVQLVITVDCGITNIEEAEYLANKGVDLIVTDHHQCLETLPKAKAVVNPNIGEYPFKSLCGAGVALKVVYALLGKEEALKYIDLAAIATVCDLVVLQGENRKIVQMGLEKINSDCRTSISALISLCSITGKIDSGHIGFIIGPRLNAAGRIYQGEIGFKLLLEEDFEKALEIGQELCDANGIRKSQEDLILKEAVEIINTTVDLQKTRVIVVAKEGWNKGVVGIVASRLVEKYHRPVFVLSILDNIATGSGRSIQGVHLFKLLNAQRVYLQKYGGHEAAAGLTIDVNKVAAFTKDINKDVINNCDDALFVESGFYDYELSLNQISTGLIKDIKRLAPMGMGNKTPVFLLRNVNISNVRFVGETKKHIKFNCIKNYMGYDCIAFSYGDRINQFNRKFNYDFLVTLDLNQWQNQENCQLTLKAFRLNVEDNIQEFISLHSKEYIDTLVSIDGFKDIKALDYKRIRHMWNSEKYILQRLKKDVLGTVIISCVPVCTQKLLSFLKQQDLINSVDVKVGNFSDKSCVVLAPDFDKTQIPHERLVIYDYAPREYINEVMEKNPNIEIVFCNNELLMDNMANFFMELNVSRETAGICYSALMEVLKIGADWTFVSTKIAKLTEFNKIIVDLVLNIFKEIGIMEVADEKISLIHNKEKKDLLSSNLISNLKALDFRISKEIEILIAEGKKR